MKRLKNILEKGNSTFELSPELIKDFGSVSTIWMNFSSLNLFNSMATVAQLIPSSMIEIFFSTIFVSPTEE